MAQRFAFIVAATALLICASGLATGQEARPPQTFPVAKVRFEQNATDGDVEVVFEVTGRAAGLTALSVTAPDGRPAISFAAEDHSTLGIRQFVFETPEPKDVAGLKAAYPEGEYTYAGTTASGGKLAGKALLSHELPRTSAFISPAADAQDVPADNLKISWAEVKGVAGYVIEIEQDDLDVNITAKLPSTVTTFAVPNELVRPGLEYQLGVGTVSDKGNISFIETAFTTARN